MRELLKTSILVFAFCFCAVAQTEEKSDCPIINIYGPSGIVEPNDSAKYSVEVKSKDENLKVEYVWSVSAGEIIKGQNTKSVLVKQPERENLTVTVKINGLPENCPNVFSESYVVYVHYQAEKIDEFSSSFAKTNKNRINEIVRVLENDPTAQLYIIFRHKENTSPKTSSQKERKISNSLVKDGLAADRITIIRDFRQSETVEFWLVPAGALRQKPKVIN